MNCLRYNIRRCNIRRCNVHEPVLYYCRCSVFCGGRRCKYESDTAWKKEDLAIEGIYSHWITDDILAMARPNPENMKKYRTVEHFRTMGIKSIINLQTPGNNHHTTISSLTLALVSPGPNKDLLACHLLLFIFSIRS